MPNNFDDNIKKLKILQILHAKEFSKLKKFLFYEVKFLVWYPEIRYMMILLKFRKFLKFTLKINEIKIF